MNARVHLVTILFMPFIIHAAWLNDEPVANQNASTAPAPEIAFAEEVYPEIERVSVEEAKAAFDSGTAVFVDVRSAEAYQAAHISGSVNIPSEELEARLGELDKTEWIITYCT